MHIVFSSALPALVLLAACSGEAPAPAMQTPADAAPEASTPDEPAPLSLTGPVVAAERAFAADAARIGWIDAYPLWAAEDGIVLQKGISSALEFAANIHPDVRGDTSLAWGPEFAGVSAGGDFGFTAGPFNGDGTAFGYYLTVWRKQADGGWRWVFEGGVDTPEPTYAPEADAPVTAIAATVPDGPADKARAALLAQEATLASQVASEGAAALGDYLAPVARVQREGEEPATDADAARVLIRQDPASLSYAAPTHVEMSAAGDMALTIGEVKWNGGGGHATRVWAQTAVGWRIVFDQIVPR
jgi:ketosteroid isomerase-like protein